MKDGAAWCNVYEHRLGTKCGTLHNRNFYCIKRKDDKRIFKGCPYNQAACQK